MSDPFEPKLPNAELYLGDGVYVSHAAAWDQVKLRCVGDGEREHVIHLERSVFDALVGYARRCWPEPGDEKEGS